MSENTSDDPLSSLSCCFKLLNENPQELVAVVDGLVRASCLCEDLRIESRDGSSIAVKVEPYGQFELDLKDGLSAFRSLLARIGTICGEISKITTFPGKLDQLMKSSGLKADRSSVHKTTNGLRYLSAKVTEKPGSPLYVLDAELTVRDPEGKIHSRHISFENMSGQPYLRISGGR